MTQNEIIEAIKAERVRQDELHPVVASKMIDGFLDDSCVKQLSVDAEDWKRINDNRENDGNATWYGVFMEEICEIFSETDPARIKEEAIQLAALCVRLCETL